MTHLHGTDGHTYVNAGDDTYAGRCVRCSCPKSAHAIASAGARADTVARPTRRDLRALGDELVPNALAFEAKR